MMDMQDWYDDMVEACLVMLTEDTPRHHTSLLVTALGRYLLVTFADTGKPRPFMARLFVCPRQDEHEPWPLFESGHYATPEAAAARALAALWDHEHQAQAARAEHQQRMREVVHHQH
jgi:hypothetical protein